MCLSDSFLLAPAPLTKSVKEEINSVSAFFAEEAAFYEANLSAKEA